MLGDPDRNAVDGTVLQDISFAINHRSGAVPGTRGQHRAALKAIGVASFFLVWRKSGLRLGEGSERSLANCRCRFRAARKPDERATNQQKSGGASFHGSLLIGLGQV